MKKRTIWKSLLATVLSCSMVVNAFAAGAIDNYRCKEHTDACYERVLICELAEELTRKIQKLIAG